jgi:hypothetical protein
MGQLNLSLLQHVTSAPLSVLLLPWLVKMQRGRGLGNTSANEMDKRFN